MSVISERIKELREISHSLELFPLHDFTGTSKVILQAVDTIEALSAKLQAEDCGGGWIYCGDGKNMPEEDGFYLVTLAERIADDADLRIKKIYFSEKSNSFVGYGHSVIAWRPLPEPYKPQ